MSLHYPDLTLELEPLLIRCPECSGEGGDYVISGGRYSSSFGNWLPNEVWQECERCQGSGRCVARSEDEWLEAMEGSYEQAHF